MANTTSQTNKTEFLAFAASVRALRGQRSQREIAEIAGISPSTVARAERGGEIYVGHALAIAKALGRTLDELMQMEWDTCPHCGGSGVTRKFADDVAFAGKEEIILVDGSVGHRDPDTGKWPEVQRPAPRLDSTPA